MQPIVSPPFLSAEGLSSLCGCCCRKKQSDKSESDLLYVRIIPIIYANATEYYATLDLTFKGQAGLDEMLNKFNITTSLHLIEMITFLCSVCFNNSECVWFLPSQWNGQVEDREHHGAAVISEQVSYDGGRDGGVAGLTYAHQSPGEHKQPVVLKRGRKKCRRGREISVLSNSAVDISVRAEC